MIELIDIVFELLAVLHLCEDALLDVRKREDRNDANFEGEFEGFNHEKKIYDSKSKLMIKIKKDPRMIN
jgi:hypothetical protein